MPRTPTMHRRRTAMGCSARKPVDQVRKNPILIAEQSGRSRFWLRPRQPPREIELTVRLEMPEETGADVGISPSFEAPLPLAWKQVLHDRLYAGVYGGLASVGAPLPDEGIGIRITQLRLSPPVESDTSPDEIRRLGETLEALTAATVAALWSGVISLRPSAA
jgi:hypothetical protein